MVLKVQFFHIKVCPIYILSIKENPLEITKIPLLKIVTVIHFVSFLVFKSLIFHSSDAYRCLILLIVAFTRVLFCMLCMCWPLLLYVVSCISIFILQFSTLAFFFFHFSSLKIFFHVFNIFSFWITEERRLCFVLHSKLCSN